ncbi:MAG: TonB-dependent receptor [Vicinamibacterales bacterium]
MSVLSALLSLTLTLSVVDPNGSPVPNASVLITTRDARIDTRLRTDAAGNIELPVVAPEFILQVEADGFARLTRAVRVAEHASTLRVTLALAGLSERVVVTADGHLQTIAEVAKALSVVDTSEIEAREEFTVVDALRTVPGISVQQLGGPGSFTSIKMRGLREQDTAVLIDGVRFRDAAAPQGDATGFAGEMYLTNVDRVEVLRGSGSSLYGSHAVGGAINLITRGGSPTPTAELRVDGGGLGLARAGGFAGGGSERRRVTFSGGAGHTRITRGVDGDDRAINSSLQGRADARVGAAATLSARTYISDAESSLNESPGAIGPLRTAGFAVASPFVTFTPALNDPDHTRDSRFASTLVRFDHRRSPRFGYTASAHYLTTTRSYRDGPLGASAFEPSGTTTSAFNATVLTVDTRADVDWTPRHTTTAGYEIERESFVSHSIPVNPAAAWEAEIAQVSHAVFLQHQVRLPALTVAVSGRGQAFALDRPVFRPADRAPFAAAVFAKPPAAITGDVSASHWIAGTSTKLRAHVGNSYRAASMYERTGSSFGSRGYTVYGDPRLGPERSISLDAGIEQMLMSGRLRASATWYRARLQRVITFGSLDLAIDPFGRSSGYITADGRTAQGVETSIRAELFTGTLVDAAYTFADAPPPAASRDGLPRAAAVPAHQWSLVLTQRIRQALQVSLQLEAASSHYVTLFDPVSFASGAYQFDGPVKADLTASYHFVLGSTRLRVSGIVENLFDQAYFVQGFRAAARTGRLGLAVTF